MVGFHMCSPEIAAGFITTGKEGCAAGRRLAGELSRPIIARSLPSRRRLHWWIADHAPHVADGGSPVLILSRYTHTTPVTHQLSLAFHGDQQAPGAFVLEHHPQSLNSGARCLSHCIAWFPVQPLRVFQVNADFSAPC